MTTQNDAAVRDLVRPEALVNLLVEATADERWADFAVELISGGKSNLTFELSSAAGQLILRRPPTGTLLPSAHDMAREARIQRALAPTAVPVPDIVLVETEGTLLGVPFYVMNKVQGVVLREQLPDGYAQSADECTRMADALVDTLIEVHRVPPDDVGLGDYGRPEGYLERQLRRWAEQSRRTQRRVIPDLQALGAELERSLPVQSSFSIVHGDFRVDNCVLDAHDPGSVRAVLDWELSTLGDPLADLAMTLLYWGSAERPLVPIIPLLTRDPRFPDRRRLLERYCQATGIDPKDLRWYEAFAHFKFSAIAQGVAARAAAGDMAGQDFGDLDPGIEALAAGGRAILSGEYS